VETPGDFSDLLYRQTVVNVPALEMRGKIRRLSGKISMKFAILSMLKPLSTFRACIRRSNSAEMLRIFCDSLYAQTAANVPESINPGYIQTISWSLWI
jgi:hypothetical protein